MIREEITRTAEHAFTVTEVSALLGLPERKIRKEIELGVLPESSPPRLPFAAVVCLLAIAAFDLYLRLTSEGRRNLYMGIRDALDRWRPDDELDDIVLADGVVRVQLKHFALDAFMRANSFLSWKEHRVLSDPDILGGEPVFKGSRLSVRQIGGLPASEKTFVLEDYPYLSEADIHFAGMFSRAYPRMGRPRESAKAAD